MFRHVPQLFVLAAFSAGAQQTITLTAPPGAPTGTIGARVIYSPNGCRNVLAYGADPTGSADSYPAISAALAALPSTGGCVYFSPGIYRTLSKISVPSRAKLIGDNQRAGHDHNHRQYCRDGNLCYRSESARVRLD